ncbi:MAG: IPExxxVDY family protein [Bacteroidales bacterium]|nr:IPExxxVDY family protein [Bacteroidales bacterium]
MMIKKQVVIKHSPQGEFFEVFAIGTVLPDYKFCALLNRLFEIDLQRKNLSPIIINGKETVPVVFSFFDEEKRYEVSIVDNKTEEGPLFVFLRTVTFFVKISPVFSEAQIRWLQRKLRSCAEITFIQKVSPANITKKQQLIDYNAVFQNI